MRDGDHRQEAGMMDFSEPAVSQDEKNTERRTDKSLEIDRKQRKRVRTTVP